MRQWIMVMTMAREVSPMVRNEGLVCLTHPAIVDIGAYERSP